MTRPGYPGPIGNLGTPPKGISAISGIPNHHTCENRWCNNTPSLGDTRCGRCTEAAEAEEHANALLDAVRHASYDIPEGPMRRFADAVVEWIEENGK